MERGQQRGVESVLNNLDKRTYEQLKFARRYMTDEQLTRLVTTLAAERLIILLNELEWEQAEHLLSFVEPNKFEELIHEQQAYQKKRVAFQLAEVERRDKIEMSLRQLGLFKEFDFEEFEKLVFYLMAEKERRTKKPVDYSLSKSGISNLTDKELGNMVNSLTVPRLLGLLDDLAPERTEKLISLVELEENRELIRRVMNTKKRARKPN
jgi:Mg/Co/Ni transporter MgtE